jgi:hypothetical protein
MKQPLEDTPPCFHCVNKIDHIAYKFLSDNPNELGRLPERLLFPRNLVTNKI